MNDVIAIVPEWLKMDITLIVKILQNSSFEKKSNIGYFMNLVYYYYVMNLVDGHFLNWVYYLFFNLYSASRR